MQPISRNRYLMRFFFRRVPQRVRLLRQIARVPLWVKVAEPHRWVTPVMALKHHYLLISHLRPNTRWRPKCWRQQSWRSKFTPLTSKETITIPIVDPIVEIENSREDIESLILRFLVSERRLVESFVNRLYIRNDFQNNCKKFDSIYI